MSTPPQIIDFCNDEDLPRQILLKEVTETSNLGYLFFRGCEEYGGDWHRLAGCDVTKKVTK